MKIDNTPVHQYGEEINRVNDSSLDAKKSRSLEASKLQIEWSDDNARMTQMGGLAYFAKFLEATGLFNDLVDRSPLRYDSNNAPAKRDVLGTLLLSVLSGQTRYAHMSALGRDKVDAALLGMGKIPSEDSVRGALGKLVQDEPMFAKTRQWLDQSFAQLCDGSLEVPWVLDVDVTIKQLYGKQEGAVPGYNPVKPGRPSHAYHSFWVGHLRLCLGVQVRPGNETSGSYGLGSLLKWLNGLSADKRPEFVRGDIGYGTETWMAQLELIGIAFLFKLKQTKGVKELIAMCERQGEWSASVDAWSYCEAELKLSGWTCSRRVVVYRRMHYKKASKTKPTQTLTGTIEGAQSEQLELLEEDAVKYEYAIYVTSLNRPADQIRPLYNPRGDNENCYDELKNQWGWGGFTLKDIARSELMAQFIALFYNWWSIYIKLVDEQVAREAITSRPMYLEHVAKISTHQRVKTLVLFCAHTQFEHIKNKLQTATERLNEWSSQTAEQLKFTSVWKQVIAHILLHHQTIGGGICRAPPEIVARN